ncbi:unnamed protein product [Mytilus coruscus]|uniref:THAP-type domain-containing protein n=1 Tax=Mytilus coruscus TaxID=42192 RepID=A0A6J8E7U7_MYTCO|nr:unnamed protein product [Mytilus coruscus]
MNAASSTMSTKKKSTGKKYCCVPGCSHTSDKIGPDGIKFILHRIPMSEKKAHIKKLWIQRLKNVRANLIVNDSTRVCSAHFDGPFTHESIPTIFPSKPMKKAQWMTWSEYKHSNTFKVLIGVTPSGMVTFISRLWGGNVSDRHIVQHDEFLPKLSKGDVIMANKGFTVEDLLPANVGLNMPPRVSTKKQMSHLEFFKTNSIASARIVVEMKMEQIKNYNILNSRLPISEAHLSEQMIFICAAFTNLLPPLLK